MLRIVQVITKVIKTIIITLQLSNYQGNKNYNYNLATK